MAQAQYGPDNPHTFSTIRTELIWEGKYDEYGNRRNVDWRLIRGLFEAGLNPIRFAQGQAKRNPALLFIHTFQ